MAWAAPAPTTTPDIADPKDKNAAAITAIRSRFIPLAPLVRHVAVLCTARRRAHMGKIAHIHCGADAC
jgi:hypothetical protein